jgi:hypothetical protein
MSIEDRREGGEGARDEVGALAEAQIVGESALYAEARMGRCWSGYRTSRRLPVVEVVRFRKASARRRLTTPAARPAPASHQAVAVATSLDAAYELD